MTQKICSKCVLREEDDPAIQFNSKGVCSNCTTYISASKELISRNNESLLEEQLKAIKSGNSKPYDCLIGLSGGTDSSYVAYLVKEWGLNPLALHLDNGWNSELSVKNVENILDKLDIDLYTYVIEWSEFRDMQKAYINASVIDIEALTDHAISCMLYRVAHKFGIKHVLTGVSTITEGFLPNSWVHGKLDYLNIQDIVAKCGPVEINSFPLLTTDEHQKYIQEGIEFISILDYVDYDKKRAQAILKTELDWTDYGGKHYESLFTKFYQGFILPEKFGVDKRRSHYSTLILADQLSREEALELLKEPSYPAKDLRIDRKFVLKKLKMSSDEFEDYIHSPQVSHFKYKSTTPTYRRYLSKLKRSIFSLPIIRRFK